MSAAAERRAAAYSMRAQAAGLATRLEATKACRATLAALVIKHGELHQTRCMAADKRRQAELQARVFQAQELAVPMASRFQPVE